MKITDNQARYHRQIRLPEIGIRGQKKISKARILVVGAGALGSAALLYLAAAGVGTICIIDGDVLELNNLHRQVLFASHDIGQPKVMAATKRLSEMNPEISVLPVFKWLDADNALELFRNYDCVLECSDNFSTKLLVNDACVMLGKPAIIGAAIGFMGQLSVYNYHDGPTYRCIYPELPDPVLFPSCADIGIMGMVPGIIGNMQALEAIKIITGAGEVLSGKLLQFDGLQGAFTEFDIISIPENKNISSLTIFETSCPDHLFKKHLMDANRFMAAMKQPDEYFIVAFSDGRGILNFGGQSWEAYPLFMLPEIMETAPRKKKLLLVCEYGIKSAEALKYLLVNAGLTNVFALRNGLGELRTNEKINVEAKD